MSERICPASIISAACAACLAVGCADEAPELSAPAVVTPTVVAHEAVEPVAAPAIAAKSPVANAASAEVQTVASTVADVDPDADPASKDSELASGDYKPPFPDRVDLFVAPKRQGGGTQTNGDNTVELMGFVRVDRQRAVLTINGEITPLAEGESQFGVEVISVRPPMVVLQRGRQRWQATLE